MQVLIKTVVVHDEDGYVTYVSSTWLGRFLTVAFKCLGWEWRPHVAFNKDWHWKHDRLVITDGIGVTVNGNLYGGELVSCVSCGASWAPTTACVEMLSEPKK